MKFKAKIKGLLNGLDPVVTAATKGTVKEFRNAQFITLSASNDYITAITDGGRMSLTSKIDGIVQSDLNYECIEPGRVTIRALDLYKMLESFSPDDEVDFEVRAAEQGKASTAAETENIDPASQAGMTEEQLTEATQQALLDSGVEVVCTLRSDPKELQTIPCGTFFVESPEIENFSKKSELRIRRDVFVNSAKRLLFAHGFEERRPMYLYWVIRADKNYIRFVAGSGGRFAVLEVLGDNVTNAEKKQTLLIPNWQTAALIDVFNKVPGDYVSFFAGERQMVIRCGAVEVILAHIDPNIKWPDEMTILDRGSKIKFTTRLGNWMNAVKGISATYSEDIKKQRHIHTASISFDASSKIIYAKANDQLKSNRKIVLDDIWSESKGSKLTFKCVSRYLDEAVKNGEADEYIQVEIEDDEKPVIVRYHAGTKIGDHKEFKKTNDMAGVSERYTIFFAPRAKEQN